MFRAACTDVKINMSQCKKCFLEIKRTDKYIRCQGLCERQFHTKCVGLQDNQWKFIVDHVNIAWFCDSCVESGITSIKDVLKDMTSSMKALEDNVNNQEVGNEKQEKLLSELVSTVRRMDENITTDTKKIIEHQEGSKTSYADKVKSKKNNQVVLIKPKEAQQNSIKTKEEVKKNIDPTTLEISGLRNIHNGGVLVECKTKESLIRLKEEIKQKLGDKYDTSAPKKRVPTVKVVGMSEKLEAKAIEEKILAQNLFLKQNEASITVVHVYEKKGPRRNFVAYVEVDGHSYNKMLTEERINIGWDRCRVYEAISITRCFKCSGYGHKASICTAKKACPKCAGSHCLTECEAENQETKCINCKRAMERLGIKLDDAHEAWSKDCKVYQRKLEIEKSKIDFLE